MPKGDENPKGGLMSDVQRWTSGSVIPSDAGGFVAYGDYLEIRTKLAESQAREFRMREALHYIVGCSTPMTPQQKECWPVMQRALDLQQDNSALREMIEVAKAEEREMCAALVEQRSERSRTVRAAINGTQPEPCEYAAAIRARKG